MPRPLKVYRTAIGFHDAYVATPTKKAALEAWGSDRDLFASGRAELVTDPELTRAPLAQPGTVLKVLRGSAAEQFAALDKASPRRGRAKPAKAAPAKPVPRPSRAVLDRAERALETAESRHDRALEALAKREARLHAERRALEQKREEELAALRAAAERAREAYDDAMRAWRG
jgi:hypothetical protein